MNGFFTVAAAAAAGIGNGSCGGVNFIGDDDFGDSDLLLDGDCDLGLAASAAAGAIGSGGCAATISTAAAADRGFNLCRRSGGGCGICCDTVKLCAAAAAAGCGGAIGCDKVNL